MTLLLALFLASASAEEPAASTAAPTLTVDSGTVKQSGVQVGTGEDKPAPRRSAGVKLHPDAKDWEPYSVRLGGDPFQARGFFARGKEKPGKAEAFARAYQVKGDTLLVIAVFPEALKKRRTHLEARFLVQEGYLEEVKIAAVTTDAAGREDSIALRRKGVEFQEENPGSAEVRIAALASSGPRDALNAGSVRRAAFGSWGTVDFGWAARGIAGDKRSEKVPAAARIGRLAMPAEVNRLDARALTLLRAGRHNDALVLLDRSLSVERDNPRALSYRAIVRLSLGDPEAAVRDYEKALPLDASLRQRAGLDIAQAYTARGRARSARGEAEQAAADYTRALSFDAAHAPALAELAQMSLTSGDGTACLPYAERAVEADPLDADAQGALGACLHAQGRSREALKPLDAAIKLQTARADLYATRAAARFAAGMKTEARRDAKRAIKLDRAYKQSLAPILR